MISDRRDRREGCYSSIYGVQIGPDGPSLQVIQPGASADGPHYHPAPGVTVNPNPYGANPIVGSTWQEFKA
jgi:hypothetical protein